MRIGGFQRLTLADFPGKVAATVFTQGCNFRCGFCHNPELVCPPLFQAPIPEEEVFAHLQARRGKLEGVVITGGEPTLHKDLVDFIGKVKAMGFAVKLDTNGSHPEVLSRLISLKLIDYIAMDVKSSLPNYALAAGVACDTGKIRASIDLILYSGLPYQLRTTLAKGVCSLQDLCGIQDCIGEAEHYVLQPFTPSEKMVDPAFKQREQYTGIEIAVLKTALERHPVAHIT